MSQHFITEFINRTYIFKPLDAAKIMSHKIKKYSASNRKNNISPEVLDESTYSLHELQVKKEEGVTQKDNEDNKHIDIII